MNWKALLGLFFVLYTVIVGGLAIKGSPGLLKLVKMKLGKNMSDEKARKITIIFAAAIGVVGIGFFIWAGVSA